LFSATLTGATFESADLTYARLRYARISDADFSNADFTQTWLVELIVDTGSTVVLTAPDTLVTTGSEYAIAGPQVDLAYVDFSGLELGYLNLQGAIFWQANLNRADFTGTDLRHAAYLPTYPASSADSPFYSLETQFAGFDPISSGWRLATAAAVPGLGPLGLGAGVLFLAATGFRQMRRTNVPK
jgi:hypothetical protein